MDFQPYKYGKTVRMPVKVVNGKLVYFYATPIPELEDGAIGEVILPEWAVINRHALLLWQAEQAVTLFEANTTLFLGMRDSSIPLHLLEEVKDFPGSEGHKLIPILLLEPLRLLLRGTKKAVLRGGKCRIPVREGAARSINHAYTLASTYYEPERMSHSGNMFRQCFFIENQKFVPLDALRGHYEAQYEKEQLQTGKPVEDAQIALEFDFGTGG
ncbi:hypothetical protein LBMAG21_17190 [Armatimonadota bacterium]|nr:hypothetical protein LBMAG21_17190 [Armatimonadota bacterium]